MCKYCDKISNIDGTDNTVKENYALDIEIERNVYKDNASNCASLNIEYGLYCYDHDHFYESIEIKYCPFCGKNLLKNERVEK